MTKNNSNIIAAFIAIGLVEEEAKFTKVLYTWVEGTLR